MVRAHFHKLDIVIIFNIQQASVKGHLDSKL